MRMLKPVLRALWLPGAWLPFTASAAVVLGALYYHEGSETPLPPQVGNFPRVRELLAKQPPKEEFSFAVVGDARTSSTFENIILQLREAAVDFVVLLGDFVHNATPEEHAHFRAECPEEYALCCPMFLVAGNHDVHPVTFPVASFERDYGPTIFDFEYQDCLFVFLRILDRPWTNEDSLAYLRTLAARDLSSYRYRFAFMHIPPAVSPDVTARPYAESDAVVELFAQLGIDFAFAGDFHGYGRMQTAKTTFIVSGGGGSSLKQRAHGGFHHAFLVRVMENGISERVLWQEHVSYFEDDIERLAIVHVYPWLSRHTALAALLVVLLGAAALAFTIRRIVRRRSPGNAAAANRSLSPRRT